MGSLSRMPAQYLHQAATVRKRGEPGTLRERPLKNARMTKCSFHSRINAITRNLSRKWCVNSCSACLVPPNSFSLLPAHACSLSSLRLRQKDPSENDLHIGWLKMYDLKFEEAHSIFGAWKRGHPGDPLGPASNAAAYLFSELARLGALESELFVDDAHFQDRGKLQPDSEKKALFIKEIAEADRLADAALQRSGVDSNALFVKSVTLGLRADQTRA